MRSPPPAMHRFLLVHVHARDAEALDACLAGGPHARAAINSVGRDGRTALGTAAAFGDLSCCEVLLKHGADPTLPEDTSLQPLALALSGGFDRVTELLRRRMGTVETVVGEGSDGVPEIEIDGEIGMDLGPIEEEPAVVVSSPQAMTWERLQRNNAEVDRSAPVRTDLELELVDLGLDFDLGEAALPRSIPEDAGGRLREVVEAILADGRVRRSALAEAVLGPFFAEPESDLSALVEGLEGRLGEAGALPADPIWDLIDPTSANAGADASCQESLVAKYPSDRAHASEGNRILVELTIETLLDGRGQSLPVDEVMRFVDERDLGGEASWWVWAAKARRRAKSAPEDVLHVRVAELQCGLVADVSSWLYTLGPGERARVQDTLLNWGGDADFGEMPVTEGGGPDGTGLAGTVSTAFPCVDSVLGDGNEGNGYQRRGLAAAQSGSQRFVGHWHLDQPPSVVLARNNMQSWLPRLRKLGHAGGVPGLRPPDEILEQASTLHRLMVDLAELHLPLVGKLVSTYRWARSHFDDVIQQGNLGLWRALFDYDPSQNSFSTYAQWWIRASVLRYLRLDGDLHLPSGAAERAGTFRDALHYLRQKQPEASWPDVAAWLNTELKGVLTLVEAIDRSERRLSWEEVEEIDTPEAKQFGSSSLEDFETTNARIRRAIQGLTEREQAVLALRFGAAECTLSDIGRTIGVSRERVRQIERTAVEKIRADLARPQETPRVVAPTDFAKPACPPPQLRLPSAAFSSEETRPRLLKKKKGKKPHPPRESGSVR